MTDIMNKQDPLLYASKEVNMSNKNSSQRVLYNYEVQIDDCAFPGFKNALLIIDEIGSAQVLVKKGDEEAFKDELVEYFCNRFQKYKEALIRT